MTKERWTDVEYTEHYSYNAYGFLSGITTSDGSSTSLTWDMLMGEGVVISANENGIETNYTYGIDRISAISGKNKTEYIYDGRGSVAAELSYTKAWYTLGGTLSKKDVVSKSYTPFGEQIGEATSGFGYNGEYYNAATGQLYLRARFYEPEMNRFSQKDIVRGSITVPSSINRYAYVQNDPVNFIDPSGESLKSALSGVKYAIKGVVNIRKIISKEIKIKTPPFTPVQNCKNCFVSSKEYSAHINTLNFFDTMRNNLLTFSFTAVLALLGIIVASEETIHPIICLIPYFLIIPFAARISYYRIASARIIAFLKIFVPEKTILNNGSIIVPESHGNTFPLIAWLVNHEMLVLAITTGTIFYYQYASYLSGQETQTLSYHVLAIFPLLFIALTWMITASTYDYKKLCDVYAPKWQLYYRLIELEEREKQHEKH